MNNRLVFFGTDTFSAPPLEALIAAGFNVVAVVTKPDARVGRGRELVAPLVKQIAAVSGDEVCRSNKPTGTIAINGKVLAEVFEKDREDRPLPSWEGCMILINGEFFLLQPHPYSFDSRYFGPVSRCDILGVARSIWTWNPPG